MSRLKQRLQPVDLKQFFVSLLSVPVYAEQTYVSIVHRNSIFNHVNGVQFSLSSIVKLL